MAERVHGTVKWFNKAQGFGFITPDGGGKDLFVHATAIEEAESLSDGQRVTFEVVVGRKGPEAAHVKPA